MTSDFKKKKIAMWDSQMSNSCFWAHFWENCFCRKIQSDFLHFEVRYHCNTYSPTLGPILNGIHASAEELLKRTALCSKSLYFEMKGREVAIALRNDTIRACRIKKAENLIEKSRTGCVRADFVLSHISQKLFSFFADCQKTKAKIDFKLAENLDECPKNDIRTWNEQSHWFYSLKIKLIGFAKTLHKILTLCVQRPRFRVTFSPKTLSCCGQNFTKLKPKV